MNTCTRTFRFWEWRMDWPPSRYQNPSANSSMHKTTSIQALSKSCEIHTPCLHNDVPDRIIMTCQNIHDSFPLILKTFVMTSLGIGFWKMKAPEKVKLFFWTASHESLPTKALLHCRGMALSPSCHRCDDHVEDVLHCLRDCPLAACIWRSLGV